MVATAAATGLGRACGHESRIGKADGVGHNRTWSLRSPRVLAWQISYSVKGNGKTRISHGRPLRAATAGGPSLQLGRVRYWAIRPTLWQIPVAIPILAAVPFQPTCPK